MQSRGVLTFAHGVNYARMAYALYLSTRQFKDVGFEVFVPFDEEYQYLKERNVPVQFIPRELLKDIDEPFWFERHAYDLSVFDVTLKMDADCLFPKGCDAASIFNEVSVTHLLNGEPYLLNGTRAPVSPYRKIDATLGLPPVYSTMFGFAKGTQAQLFFGHVKQFYKEWHNLPMLADVPRTTDTLYSIAWLATKPTNCGLHGTPFHHMKPATMNWDTEENWTQNLPVHIDIEGRVFVNGVRVGLPMHYQDKDFLTQERLERLEKIYVCSH